MKKHLLILLWLTISCSTFAQKPKKIFSSLQEGNLKEAQEEYAKIKSDKVYDTEDKILFEIANSIFLINKSYTNYNPILSINYYNNIYRNIDNYFNTPKSKKDIVEFLAKYDLTFDKISNQINAELVKEAKQLNTVESYSNALEVCTDNYRLELSQLKEEASYIKTIQEASINSYKSFISNYNQSYHKDEIQSLLERKVLNIAKNNHSISELNSFIKEYSNSKLNQEATDVRDSIVLSKVPNEYDAMFVFTKEYPNSKFINDIQLKLPYLLFEQTKNKNYSWESVKIFLDKYPNDYRVKQLDSIIYFTMNKFSILNLENYRNIFINGKYLNKVQNIKDVMESPYERNGSHGDYTYSPIYFILPEKAVKNSNCYIIEGNYPQFKNLVNNGETNKITLNGFETIIQSKLKSNFFNLPKSYLKRPDLINCPKYSPKKEENEKRFLISSDYEIHHNGDTLISIIQDFSLTVWGGNWSERGLNVSNFDLRNKSELKNLITKNNINQLIGDVNSFFELKISKLNEEDSISKISSNDDYYNQYELSDFVSRKEIFIKDILSSNFNDLQVFFYKGIPHLGYNNFELHRGSHFESYFIPLPSVQFN